jgi:hypothetical protein
VVGGTYLHIIHDLDVKLVANLQVAAFRMPRLSSKSCDGREILRLNSA